MAPPPRSRSTSLGRSPVIVNVSIVVVRSGTARARTVAFRNPIATDVSAIPMSQSEPYLEVLPRAQIIPSVDSWKRSPRDMKIYFLGILYSPRRLPPFQTSFETTPCAHCRNASLLKESWKRPTLVPQRTPSKSNRNHGKSGLL